MKTIALVLSLLTLTACVSTAPIGQNLTSGISNDFVIKDLRNTAFNLDQAIAVGALAADDPASRCIHDVLQRAGLEGVTEDAQTFKPEVSGLFSAQAVLYIKLRQAARSSRAELSADCKAIVGELLIDGVTSASKLMPVTTRLIMRGL